MGNSNIYAHLSLLGLVLNLTGDSARAQENDPELGKKRPRIEYCSNKLIPGLEPDSPLIVFIDTLKSQIGNPDLAREDIYQMLKVGFALEYFHQPQPPTQTTQSHEESEEDTGPDPALTPKQEPHYGLPPEISKWSEILKLDDCLDFVKNVGLPKSEWEQKCIEIKMPKTLMDLKEKLSIKDEIEFLKYLQRNDHKTSRINGSIQKVILDHFKKDLVVGHYSQVAIQNFEKKSAQYYRHFVSELPIIYRYWQHPKAVKKFDPEKLSRSIWNVTHIIPAYPGYLSQKMVVDPDGIKGPLGETMKLKFGVYDSGDSTQPFTSSRLPNWSKSGIEKQVVYLGYNPGPNGSSDVDTLYLSLYAYLDDPRHDLIEFTCYVVGEPATKLVCRGKTKTAANPAQPYSQAMKDQNAFLMIFKRAD